MSLTEFLAPASPRKPMSAFVFADQSEGKVQKVWGKATPLLTSGEQIEHILVQNLSSMTVFPGATVLTNRRVIMMKSKLITMDFVDLLWRNLLDAHLVEGVLGSTLSFKEESGRVLFMDSLPKEAARAAYAYGQVLEEGAIEFRRQRVLEETRAAARGVAFAVESERPIPVAPVVAVAPEDPAALLQSLKGLLEKGLITDEEYQAKRAAILARL